MLKLGQELRGWRARQRGKGGRCMSQGELAELVGCSEATIGRLERGERAGTHSLQVRLWALILASAAELAGARKPLAKAGSARRSDGRQLCLPMVVAS